MISDYISKKKLIKFGWDMPSPAYLSENLQAMEQLPFDGVVIKLPETVNQGNMFDVAKFDTLSDTWASATLEVLNTLKAIPFNQFTDNFISLFAASTMDWFNDAHWSKVMAQVRFCAQAARACNCKGVLWDPEAYGPTPWIYHKQPGAADRSFEQFRAKVRERGRDFMSVLMDEMPNMVVFTLRLLSDFGHMSYYAGHILETHDPLQRDALLPDFAFGLHADFLNGMLDAIKPGVRIIDGNEDAYYFTSPLEFYQSYRLLRRNVLSLVAPENINRYHTQVEVGSALYIDYVYGLFESLPHGYPEELYTQAHYLSAEERDRWLEHNVYYALTTADEYVWMWTEQANWWTGQGLPPGAVDAVRSAQHKLQTGQDLGFDMHARLLQAQDEARRTIAKRG
jgi:hypothetical protein